jgi:hypothetical protein
MAAPAAIDTAGINLDWLNLDTEQGMRVRGGRRGLTLDDINAMTYGVAGREEAGVPVFAPRGAALDARSPRHGRQYRDKGDVWSESAMMLYEEANQRQWSSARDIPWEKVGPLPDDLEWAMCTLCTFLTQVEFIAGDIPGRYMEQVHPDHFEAQLFLGTQIMDESRHLDVFRKRTLVNGGGMVDAGFGAINLLSVDDFTEMTALLHLFGEGFVQTLFRMGELISQNEAEKKIFRLAAQDESRHLAFGVTHLKYVMDTQPWRKEELHNYLDIQEGALGQSQQAGLTTNPMTGEALAILAGGGIDEIDEGYGKLMVMRKRQVNEYAHRLDVIGLGDRRARMGAGFKEFLDPID